MSAVSLLGRTRCQGLEDIIWQLYWLLESGLVRQRCWGLTEAGIVLHVLTDLESSLFSVSWFPYLGAP